MNYKTYAEAKIANPDCDIFSNGEEFGAIKNAPTSHFANAWVICNPADYCSSLKEFFDNDLILVKGDAILEILDGYEGVFKIWTNATSFNEPDDEDETRYILSAAALNGGCKIPDQKAVQLALQAKINEKRKMRQFNLEEAKDGKPICTRDGRSARIICTNRICGELSIVALVMSRFGTEDATSHTLSGQYFGGDGASPMDLFMETVIEKRWIAVNPYTRAASFLHSSKEDCEDFMVCIGDSAGYQAIEVEVEI